MFGVHSMNEHLRTLLSLLIEVILFNLSIKQSAFQIVKELSLARSVVNKPLSKHS